ncbi:MAG: hypothetical protein K6G15_06680 [Desulfovibrio sp.]|nr:hypothetical protein [Desulfovibrio sp.]
MRKLADVLLNLFVAASIGSIFASKYLLLSISIAIFALIGGSGNDNNR